MARFNTTMMEERLLETAMDTNTTTTSTSGQKLNRTDDECDSDTITDPVNKHRDDPANLASCATTSRLKSKRRKAPKREYSSRPSKGATGTNADLNHRDPVADQGDEGDRHRKTFPLQ